MQNLKRLLCLTIPAIVIFAILSADDRVPSTDEPETDSRNYYIADGKRVHVAILRDRIGIVLNEDVAIEAAQALIDDAAWTLDQKGEVGIKVLRASGPHEVHELEAFVRRLTERNAQRKSKRPIKSAGLLVATYGAKAPMLLTEEFVVVFKENVTPEVIDKLNSSHNVEVVRKSPFERNRFVLRSTAASDLSFLEASVSYHKSGQVDLAHPNFVRPKVPRNKIPNDPLFCAEWHHENTGQNGGTPDADIDTPLAWDLSQGSADRMIAVIDCGFQVTHPDLIDNVWTNRGEIPGDGIDNDGNGFVDDVHGWNFKMDSGDLNGLPHGTRAAGCVGARGNNAIGVSGTCPECSLMLIKLGLSDSDDADAFEYARHMGAEVITNSWGYPDMAAPSPIVSRAINRAARHGRNGRGCVIFFAMPDENCDACGCPGPDVSALESVIAVSSSSNVDRLDNTGFGDCMDVLGPTKNFTSPTGTLGITTTNPSDSYMDDFGGTSAAAPITAGIASLVLEVAPRLTRLQIQRLIQDTTDKIENSRGAYSIITGFSSPPTGGATHGYGRVNAFEAVRVVAPIALGGRGGVDIMLRDNPLDWGNTEQPSSTYFESPRTFIPYWESPDILVDAPPFQPAPTSSRQFDRFTDEQPLPNTTNRVYVRIRNRGPLRAEEVTVKLHWALTGSAAPSLPADFWTDFPDDSSDTSQWHPLKARNISELSYCGTSVAGSGRPDVAQIAAFDFTPPAGDPKEPASQQYGLLCIAESPQDAVSAESRHSFVPDWFTPRDNNITMRNLVLQPLVVGASLRVSFFVRNPFQNPLKTQLAVKAPQGWTAQFLQSDVTEAFRLKPNEQRIVALNITAPALNSTGEILINQFEEDSDQHRAIGGLTIRVRPASQPAPLDAEK